LGTKLSYALPRTGPQHRWGESPHSATKQKQPRDEWVFLFFEENEENLFPEMKTKNKKDLKGFFEGSYPFGSFNSHTYCLTFLINASSII